MRDVAFRWDALSIGNMPRDPAVVRAVYLKCATWLTGGTRCLLEMRDVAYRARRGPPVGHAVYLKCATWPTDGTRCLFKMRDVAIRWDALSIGNTPRNPPVGHAFYLKFTVYPLPPTCVT
ncbi:hypothetical protein J6590_065070 [Homalodisca vitripennis]|nr:hypothetical protein J6590_065070 [Homalodisca vitripennis]